MKQTDPPPKKLSGTGWHPLGELELKLDEKADSTVRAWITETLGPLNLNVDISNRILRSAQEAVTRAAITDGTSSPLEHLHLFLFASADRTSEGHTWGFFRIEKFENAMPDNGSRDHAIEFFLYLERQ